MIALEPFLVSARLAAAVTSILLVLCPPLARLRLSTDKAFAALLESVAILPMVLPPTVLGFYFLAGLSPSSPVGASSSGASVSASSSPFLASCWPAVSSAFLSCTNP